MSDTGVILHLHVPGLLGPMPAFDPQMQPTGWPDLERWLSRSHPARFSANTPEATLLALFGVPFAETHGLPTAAYRRIGDGAEPDPRYWLQLTPLHLRPDQDRLLAFDTEGLDFTQDEAAALASLFREHFTDQPWQLELAAPDRWYLALEQAPELITHEVSEVLGRNVDSFLPKGADGKRWHALMNEIQMLFFNAPLNQQREMEGRGIVNGLWCFGGGTSQQHLQPGFQQVVGEGPLLKGLARCAGLDVQPLPSSAAALLQAEESLLVHYSGLQRPVVQAEPYAWIEALGAFEGWLAPLVDRLGRGVDQLILYTGNGQSYQLGRAELRRFWRRRRPMPQWLDTNPNAAG